MQRNFEGETLRENARDISLFEFVIPGALDVRQNYYVCVDDYDQPAPSCTLHVVSLQSHIPQPLVVGLHWLGLVAQAEDRNKHTHIYE